MDFDSAFIAAPRYRSLPEPYRNRLMELLISTEDGERLRDADVASSYGLSPEGLAEMKAAFVERGYFDEDWVPEGGQPAERARRRSSNAERQARFKAKQKAAKEARNGARGVTGNVTPSVTGNGPGNALGNAPVTPGNAQVTPVTPGNASPPTPPPIKSLTLESLVQTDTHTLSGRACDGEVTRPVTVMGPDGPVEVRPECSPEDVDRLIVLVNRYFDPYCRSEQVGRFVRNWSVYYPPDWIEAVLAKLAGMAADGRSFGEGLGRSLLQGWARGGGLPERDRVPARDDVEAAAQVVPMARASPSRGSPPERPMTRQQRKMARYAEIAFGPGEGEDDGDGRGEAVGQADHGGPRREDQVHGRAGA